MKGLLRRGGLGVCVLVLIVLISFSVSAEIIGSETFTTNTGGPNNLQGFGAPNWKTGDTTYGGGDDGTFAMVFHGNCTNNDRVAYLTFTTTSAYNSTNVTIRHLLGFHDSSFDVYVNNIFVGHYADAPSDPEVWTDTTFDTSGISGTSFEVKLVATGAPWIFPAPKAGVKTGCALWGQAGVSFLSLNGDKEMDGNLVASSLHISYIDRDGKKYDIGEGGPVVIGGIYYIEGMIIKKGSFAQPDSTALENNLKINDKVVNNQKTKLGDMKMMSFINTTIIFTPNLAGNEVTFELVADSGSAIQETTKDDNIINSTHYVLQPHPPVISNLTLSPDYLKFYDKSRDWVKYSDVFNNGMKCSFILTDSDTNQKIIYATVKAEITANGKQPSRTKDQMTFSTDTTCSNGKMCNVTFPASIIYPSDQIDCNVTAVDSFNAFYSNISNIVQLPTFDLYLGSIDVLNVISSPSLVAGKPHVGRVFPTFSSNLISELDVQTNVTFTQMKADNSNKQSYSSSVVGINSYNLANLKKDPLKLLGTGLNGGSAVYSYYLLQKIKDGQDSANFQNLSMLSYGSWKFTALVNSDNKIKESDTTNNDKDAGGTSVTLTKKASERIKDYRIGFVIINYSTSVSQAMIDTANQSAQIGFNFVANVFPLANGQVKMVFNATVIKINYDPSRLTNKNPASRIYASQVRQMIEDKLNDWKSANNIDFAVAFVLDRGILMSSNAALLNDPCGISPIGSHTALLFVDGPPNKECSAKGLLAHEMGHGYLSIPTEEYNDPQGVIGKSTTEVGWDISYINDQLQGGTIYGRPIINIWPEIAAGKTGNTHTDDVPESNNVWLADRRLDMGIRFMNVMGGGGFDDSYWPSQTFYDKAFTKLIMDGFIKR